MSKGAAVLLDEASIGGAKEITYNSGSGRISAVVDKRFVGAAAEAGSQIREASLSPFFAIDRIRDVA